jgi:multidrug efflux pump subunit AcrB
MWLVAVALRRPYTFVVMAMLIVLLSVVTIRNMGTDILPDIDIPVISIAWNYTGMSPEEMEKRVTFNFERALTTTVNDIEHIESQSLFGISIVKLFFHPGTNIAGATAQVTAISQTMLRQMPPGMLPPLVMRYSATNVPILWLSLGSETLPEQELFDQGVNFLRTGLVMVQGAQLPFPYGGKSPSVMVDVDPKKLSGLGLTASDISDALNNQSLIIPAGTAKFGDREYSILLNSSPELVAQFDNLPIKAVNGRTVFMKDIGHIRFGAMPQTSMSHVDGKKGVVQPILKSEGASTLDIVSRVRATLKSFASSLNPELHISPMFDQSVFVRAAVDGVIKEAVIAASLTGLMILLFLGSWRSTLIVVVSIPLSILTSIIVLSWLGQTLNLMTLGGMALAVGILVDDATVTIENIHRNLSEPDGKGARKGLFQAIMDGAAQIAVPAFVSTLCICIVFVPVVFIAGAAKSLFVPLAMAVVFAMLMSYFLSRTLVPTLILFLLRNEAAEHGQERAAPGIFTRFHAGFERAFAAFQALYGRLLAWALAHRTATTLAMLGFLVISAAIEPLVGRDFFPSVDSGQFRLHVRCPPGTRIEESERYLARIEEVIRADIPAQDLAHISDIIGIPTSSINLSLSDGTLVSPADGEILVSLTPEHQPTATYVERIRRQLALDFPEVTAFFQAADITSQVLNFGLAAPIDIQISGPLGNQERNLVVAERIMAEIRRVPGAADVHLNQVLNAPTIHLEVDRTQAQQAGLSQRDVSTSMLISLSSSLQTAPNWWLDYAKGIQYAVQVQAPQYQIDSTAAMGNIPVSNGASGEVLANLATLSRSTAPVNLTHYNATRTLDVLMSVAGTDLGSVSDGVNRIIDKIAGLDRELLPRGTTISVRGQVESMNSSFRGLSLGLILAVVLVYLLMVVNFQSWSDPLIIIGAIPGALGGIVWMLFITQTTLSVPALMGAIMSIGVATANSILIVSFANDQRDLGLDAHGAAMQAGLVRLRPVLMTAAAMIIGMIPMALGVSDGGEQNAPLGRAVIGGLLLATFSTLFFVPVVYSAVNRRQRAVGHAAPDTGLLAHGGPTP